MDDFGYDVYSQAEAFKGSRDDLKNPYLTRDEVKKLSKMLMNDIKEIFNNENYLINITNINEFIDILKKDENFKDSVYVDENTCNEIKDFIIHKINIGRKYRMCGNFIDCIIKTLYDKKTHLFVPIVPDYLEAQNVCDGDVNIDVIIDNMPIKGLLSLKKPPEKKKGILSSVRKTFYSSLGNEQNDTDGIYLELHVLHKNISYYIRKLSRDFSNQIGLVQQMNNIDKLVDEASKELDELLEAYESTDIQEMKLYKPIPFNANHLSQLKIIGDNIKLNNSEKGLFGAIVEPQEYATDAEVKNLTTISTIVAKTSNKMESQTNYYAILDVNSQSTIDQITENYKMKALQNHPDKKRGNTEMMALINLAYSILSDPVKRAEYDKAVKDENSEELQRIHDIHMPVAVLKVAPNKLYTFDQIWKIIGNLEKTHPLAYDKTRHVIENMQDDMRRIAEKSGISPLDWILYYTDMDYKLKNLEINKEFVKDISERINFIGRHNNFRNFTETGNRSWTKWITGQNWQNKMNSRVPAGGKKTRKQRKRKTKKQKKKSNKKTKSRR